MDAAKARAIIEKLQQDLLSVNDQNFQSYHTKLKSYTSSIFGKDSEEYKLKECLESIDLGMHVTTKQPLLLQSY